MSSQVIEATQVLGMERLPVPECHQQLVAHPQDPQASRPVLIDGIISVHINPEAPTG